MEVASLLCDSFLCRLCAEENKNSTNLFPVEENDQDLSQLINKYLPVKIERDGKLPSKICPGCHIQLEATKSFLDLIVEGQNKLRELFRIQQETLRRQEKQRQQLEAALKNVNPNTSVETYTIQSDETGEKFLIQIFSDGPLFPPDHELSLRSAGLEKPRKKRGRPPKPPPDSNEEKESSSVKNELKTEQEPDEDVELDSDGRRKRRIKVPTRFLEAVQGKELDRIFKEEGVIEDSLSDNEVSTNDINSITANDEVIGHMQSRDGENLGELVVVNKNIGRTKVRSKTGGSAKKRKKYECDICGREFLHYGRYEVHKTFHKNVKFECDEATCHLQADTKLHIEEHQNETGHAGITVIETVEAFDNESSTADAKPENIGIEAETQNTINGTEESLKTTENKLICNVCNKKFTCKQNYEIHCKAVHESVKPYQCDKCDKAFPYLNSLKCHMLQHTDKNEKLYPCEICKKVFNHPSSLVYHREAEHNNGRRFVCKKCNKSFKHKQLLQRHQLVHSDERPHVCKMCDATFKTRANLLNHIPIHTGEKKYYCTQCPQTFAHKTSLTLHIRWHNGQKPYQCDVCMKSFSQKGNLAEHKRIHTGEKPYCCDHCGRKFTTSSQYKLHLKRHTGERPWRCEYCSKTFLHKDTWKCHTRRHRDERPFQCVQCFRGFTEQWALKKHERLHTGEKPYICDVCSKGFADCSNLAKHKKIHNGKVSSKDVNKIPTDFKVVTEEGDNQVLYLTYQNTGVEENQDQTLVHIMDTFDPLQNEDSQTSSLENAILDPKALKSSVMEELSLDQPMQLQQVTDQDGNPISLTTSDGQQIKVVTSTDGDQQNIQGLLPDGTLVPINLTLQDGKAVGGELLSPTVEMDKTPETETADDPKFKSDENGDSGLSSSSVGQLLDNNIQFLTKLDNNIQFLTEDGQNVCFVTAYNVDDPMNQQYLTMA